MSRDPAPLTRGPLTLLSLEVSKVNLQALGAGQSTLLVRWTRFWKVVSGVACVESTADGWTQVRIAELFSVDERTIRRWWSNACSRLRELVGGDLLIE